MSYEYKDRYGEYPIFKRVEGGKRTIAIADRPEDAAMICDALNAKAEGEK